MIQNLVSQGTTISTALVSELATILRPFQCTQRALWRERRGQRRPYANLFLSWVANFYARHEAPYLHTLTIVFLVALFVGLCQLCRTPSQTHAVEPFMLTTIAYHTFFLGLWDREPPYLLRWEVEFRKRISVLVIWLAFNGFDTWYWWFGVWKMKPSNGPWGTVIFFPYVGNTPLFGPDQWISIAAKILNALSITILSCALARLCFSTLQQRSLDMFITAERLRSLASQWLQSLARLSADKTLEKTEEDNTAAKECRVIISAESDSISYPGSIKDASQKAEPSPVSQHDPENPPPYRKLTRTGTGLLTRRLWRTMSGKDFEDPSVPPPEYMLYEPRFEDINVAYDLLKATTTCPKPKPRVWGYYVLRTWLFGPIWIFKLCQYLVTQTTHPFNPRKLLAITTHSANLQFACSMSYPTIMRLAVRDPCLANVSSKDLLLASRIILSTEKVVHPSRAWWLAMGYTMLSVCSVLIIGTELTIQWNRITGVQDLTSVGQLIPFTLGVGSLLKILWSAMMEREEAQEFCYFGHCAKEAKGQHWKEAGEMFLKCREELEKARVSEAMQERKSAEENC
ncbi:hypothetical protein, variant 1 [Verruconis gallopava]|uniref:Uncharacterized protein n=1 Tax=Verruconis gallopava TaxID=253628 RepID=A0A0D2AQZ9_9PEZI|nr:hypothetical protein, variant 1 [Verruconis gallopava]KIW09118.1 hypothetical protein, variant 1 [Verruconis gallopava]